MTEHTTSAGRRSDRHLHGNGPEPGLKPQPPPDTDHDARVPSVGNYFDKLSGMRVTVIVTLLVVLLQVPVRGEPLRLRLGWDDMRAVASHVEIEPRVTIWLDPDGNRLVKGRLTEITGGGITLGKRVKKQAHRLVPRSEVHSVRLIEVVLLVWATGRQS